MNRVPDLGTVGIVRVGWCWGRGLSCLTGDFCNNALPTQLDTQPLGHFAQLFPDILQIRQNCGCRSADVRTGDNGRGMSVRGQNRCRNVIDPDKLPACTDAKSRPTDRFAVIMQRKGGVQQMPATPAGKQVGQLRPILKSQERLA
jgi:hypothetical protein